MSDEFRRYLEQQEALRRLMDPLYDVRSHLAFDDPFKRLGIDPSIVDLVRQEDEHRKLLADLAGVDAAARALQEFNQQNQLISGPLEEARRLGLLDEYSDVNQSVKAILEAKQSYDNQFRLPHESELGAMAHEALIALSLPRTLLDSETSLAAAMATMHSPWLRIEEPLASAKALSELVAIGRGIEGMSPFDTVLSDSLRSGLGDWRDWVTAQPQLLVDPVIRTALYFERGFDPNLTDFTTYAFDEGLLIAGLRETQPRESTEEDEEGFARARAAFALLQRFEIALRAFIESAMKSAFGDKWMKQQLPSGMLDSWIEKRDKAVKAGLEERPLIEYADFSDYKAIIERKDNWSKVFHTVFVRPEDVRESLQRLFPVRIATMHARLITRDDELLLLVETKRVLKAIGAA